MIAGLGIYLISEFGQEEKFAAYFGLDHWEGNEGWYWMREEQRFVTTQSRMILEYLLSDSNIAIRSKADEMIALQMQEEEEKLKKEESEKSKKEKNQKMKQQEDNVDKLVRQKYKEAKQELKKVKMSGRGNIDEADVSKNIMRRKRVEIKRNQHRKNDEEVSIDAEDLINSPNKKPSTSLEFNNHDEQSTASSSITANSLMQLKTIPTTTSQKNIKIVIQSNQY